MNTMGPSTSTLSRALPALLAAAVVSIVLGIVGMHALNTHGVQNDTDHATMTNPLTSHMSGSHADMSADPKTSGPTGAAVAVTTFRGGGNTHDMGDMVMLCVVMLAAAAGALLFLLHGMRRKPRFWAHPPTAYTRVTRWVTARLGTGPPPVWEFSVIRC